MAHVTVTSEFKLAQQIVSGHHRLTADEPIARGGSEKRATLIDNFGNELRAHTDVVVYEDQLNRTELEVPSTESHPAGSENDR